MPISQTIVINNDTVRSNLVADEDVSVTTTAVEIATSTSERRGLTFKNLGTAEVYFDQKAAVSATSHKFSLNPGGFYELPFVSEPYTGAWWAMAASGTNTVCIRETLV